jgi:acetylglutamate kinase
MSGASTGTSMAASLGASSGPVTVVKLGGRAQSDPALPDALAELWWSVGGRLCVVHGGGDAISALQRARGDTPQFVGGRPRKTPAGRDVIRMALSGLTNKQLVAAFRGAGLPAVGLSGEDGGLIAAEPTGEAHMGLVGAPATINVSLLALLFDGGYLPVISPLAANNAGGEAAALNVNGDDAASAIAVALGAAELFFMADVPGVLDGGAVVPTLGPAAAERLVSSGVAAGGMAAKLEAARAALDGGVGRVRIGDLAALGDATLGTSIVAGSTLSTGHAHEADATNAAPGSTGSPITQSAV